MDEKKRKEIALMRYGKIAPVINGKGGDRHHG